MQVVSNPAGSTQHMQLEDKTQPLHQLLSLPFLADAKKAKRCISPAQCLNRQQGRGTPLVLPTYLAEAMKTLLGRLGSKAKL